MAESIAEAEKELTQKKAGQDVAREEFIKAQEQEKTEE